MLATSSRYAPPLPGELVPLTPGEHEKLVEEITPILVELVHARQRTFEAERKTRNKKERY